MSKHVRQSRLLAIEQQGTVLNVFPSQQQALAYTPYGHRNLRTQISSLLGFTAQYLEGEVGAYILGRGYRVYSPTFMRFFSPDSLSPFDLGGMNAYSYVEGSPLKYSDPSGHGKGQKLKYSGPGFQFGANTLFFETTEGGRRIGNLDTHGNEQVIMFGGNLIDGKQLAPAMEAKGIHPTDYDAFRLITCLSADGSAPVGAAFSKSTDLRVLSFEGKVDAADKAYKPARNNEGSVVVKDYYVQVENPYKPKDPRYKSFQFSPVLFYQSRRIPISQDAMLALRM
jgi:RHS repeat-associated protein